MTYKQLLDYLENMTDDQMGMPVTCVSIDGGYHYPSAIAVVEIDHAEASEEVIVWPKGQVVLI